MKNVKSLVLGLAIFALLWPVGVLYAQQGSIPALAAIPDNLSDQTKAAFRSRKDELEKIYSAFKAAGDAFTAKSAKDQSDAEYDALTARRSQYILAVTEFNRDVANAAAASPQTSAKSAPYALAVGVTGEFYMITKDGRKLTGAAAAKCPLDGHTRVVVAENSRVQFLLPDGTIFTLGPNSDMVIDDFVYDPATSASKFTASFAKGTFRFVTGKITTRNPDDLKIKVAVGTIGVRGTDFECVIDPSGAGYIKLFEGRLAITKKKTGDVLLLNAGQMTSFTADGDFSPPNRVSP